MSKKRKPNLEEFDQNFDEGKVSIDFSQGTKTNGLSKLIKLAPMSIPYWVNLEIEKIAQLQANSKSSVVRQLLVDALTSRNSN